MSKANVANSIHRKSSTCLRKSTSGDIFCTPTEVHFRAQHLRKSLLLYENHSSFTEITHLLRKSLISYENHSSLTEVTFNTKVTYLTEVGLNYRSWLLVLMAYGSQLQIMPFSRCLCGLRKSTSVILWLTEVDFRFVVYDSSIVTHRSILLKDAYTYLYLSIDAWQTWLTWEARWFASWRFDED